MQLSLLNIEKFSVSGSNTNLFIYYAMSLPIEVNSRKPSYNTLCGS